MSLEKLAILDKDETTQQLFDEGRTLLCFDELEGLTLMPGESSYLLEHLIKKNLVVQSKINSEVYRLTEQGEKCVYKLRVASLDAYKNFLLNSIPTSNLQDLQ